MSDRRTTSNIRQARVIRPPVSSSEADTLDDTDENHPAPRPDFERPPSVQRTRTPADLTLSDLIGELKASDNAAVPSGYLLALEAIVRRVAEDREALERQLAQAQQTQTRRSRLLSIVKGIGAGSIVAALAVVAQALIAHGDGAAVARQQALHVSQLQQDVIVLKQSVSDLRAQAAADHSLIQIFAARLSAANQ